MLARFVPLTNHAVLTVASLSPYLMAGAGVSAVLLLLVRRWRSAAVAALLTAVAVAVQLPLFVGSEKPAGNTVPVRVMTANVSEGQADPVALAAAIRDGADIVMFQELTPDLVRALTQEGMGSVFPHQLTDARNYAEGVAIWSRYPIGQSSRLPDFPLGLVTAAIQVPGVARDVTVALVHVSGPWPQPIDAWHDEMTRLPDRLERIATKAGSAALIVAGDFNATHDMGPFRKLFRNGLRDAAEQSGAGFTNSFPADATFPPVIGIDHVLTRNSTADAVQTFRIPGSDHLGLQATVHLPTG